MMTDLFRWKGSVGLFLRAVAIGLVLGASSVLLAQQSPTKEESTPGFWQRDPQAHFPDEGRMHCAPAAISDGLIYLSRAFGMQGLVPGSDHDSQMGLITDLAEQFHTDPSIGGTNPDRIITGLRSYVGSKGYAFNRLEVMTWRGLSSANQKCKLGEKPSLSWMREAANSKDTVVAFNFGWYQRQGDSYLRNGGHWVAVVGTTVDPAGFIVRNPALPGNEQSTKTSVMLTLLNEDFPVGTGHEQANRNGYYRGGGPGLPHGQNVTAVLDAVIVFSLKKPGS